MAFNYDLFKKVVAKEFATRPNDEIDLFANEAEKELDERVWVQRYPRAWALITAHLMKLSDLNSKGTLNAGVLKKTKVGDLEREFDTTGSKSDDTYMLTFYGKEFLRLRKQIVRGPIFA